MKKLDATEKEREEDYTSRKKDARDFLKRLRAVRERRGTGGPTTMEKTEKTPDL